MASDWIKWEKGLTEKPEVYGIARELQLDRDTVAGKLMRLWEWADGNTRDGHVPHIAGAAIDEKTGVHGFASAMESVGWLEVDDGGVTFPNFSRHNGQSAKRRATEAERKAAERELQRKEPPKTVRK